MTTREGEKMHLTNIKKQITALALSVLLLFVSTIFGTASVPAREAKAALIPSAQSALSNWCQFMLRDSFERAGAKSGMSDDLVRDFQQYKETWDIVFGDTPYGYTYEVNGDEVILTPYYSHYNVHNNWVCEKLSSIKFSLKNLTYNPDTDRFEYNGMLSPDPKIYINLCDALNDVIYVEPGFKDFIRDYLGLDRTDGSPLTEVKPICISPFMRDWNARLDELMREHLASIIKERQESKKEYREQWKAEQEALSMFRYCNWTEEMKSAYTENMTYIICKDIQYGTGFYMIFIPNLFNVEPFNNEYRSEFYFHFNGIDTSLPYSGCHLFRLDENGFSDVDFNSYYGSSLSSNMYYGGTPSNADFDSLFYILSVVGFGSSTANVVKIYYSDASEEYFKPFPYAFDAIELPAYPLDDDDTDISVPDKIIIDNPREKDDSEEPITVPSNPLDPSLDYDGIVGPVTGIVEPAVPDVPESTGFFSSILNFLRDILQAIKGLPALIANAIFSLFSPALGIISKFFDVDFTVKDIPSLIARAVFALFSPALGILRDFFDVDFTIGDVLDAIIKIPATIWGLFAQTLGGIWTQAIDISGVVSWIKDGFIGKLWDVFKATVAGSFITDLAGAIKTGLSDITAPVIVFFTIDFTEVGEQVHPAIDNWNSKFADIRTAIDILMGIGSTSTDSVIIDTGSHDITLGGRVLVRNLAIRIDLSDYVKEEDIEKVRAVISAALWIYFALSLMGMLKVHLTID